MHCNTGVFYFFLAVKKCFQVLQKRTCDMKNGDNTDDSSKGNANVLLWE